MKNHTSAHTLRPSTRRLPIGIAIAATLSMGLVSQAGAATRTWDGGAGGGNWSNVQYPVQTDFSVTMPKGRTNWSSLYTESLISINTSLSGDTGSMPGGDTGLPAKGDSLVFQGNGGLNNTNSYIGFTVGSMTFASGAGSFVVGGYALTSVGNITNSSSNLQTINLGLKVGADQTWDGGTSGMNFNGAVDVGTSALSLRNRVIIDNSGLNFTVGSTGTAALTIASGSTLASATGTLGAGAASRGTVTVTGAGSQWRNTSSLVVGSQGTGTLNILDSGRVSAQALTIGTNGTLNLGEGAQLSTVDGSVNGNSVTFNGNSSIQGNFTNNGSVVGSAGTLSFLNDVNGAGSYGGNVAFKAGFNPGNSPAAVSFGAGNASFDSGSVLNMEIFGATPGAQYDQLVNINTLTFNGTLNLVFGNGYVPLAGSSFALFGFNTFSGSFGTAATGYDHITVSGYDRSKLDFSHLATDGSVSVTAVPEPESYAMLLAGLALMGAVARRRARKQHAA